MNNLKHVFKYRYVKSLLHDFFRFAAKCLAQNTFCRLRLFKIYTIKKNKKQQIVTTATLKNYFCFISSQKNIK